MSLGSNGVGDERGFYGGGDLVDSDDRCAVEDCGDKGCETGGFTGPDRGCFPLMEWR